MHKRFASQNIVVNLNKKKKKLNNKDQMQSLQSLVDCFVICTVLDRQTAANRFSQSSPPFDCERGLSVRNSETCFVKDEMKIKENQNLTLPSLVPFVWSALYTPLCNTIRTKNVELQNKPVIYISSMYIVRYLINFGWLRPAF